DCEQRPGRVRRGPRRTGHEEPAIRSRAFPLTDPTTEPVDNQAALSVGVDAGPLRAVPDVPDVDFGAGDRPPVFVDGSAHLTILSRTARGPLALPTRWHGARPARRSGPCGASPPTSVHIHDTCTCF